MSVPRAPSPGPHSAETPFATLAFTQAAAEVVTDASDDGDQPPKKGLGIDVTPP